MLIYVAGPYSADDHDGITANIQHAREAAIRLWEGGHAVICPHLNTAHFEVDCDCNYDQYIEGDLTIIARCDAVYMLNNWTNSRGSMLEHAYAEGLGKIIFYEVATICPLLHPTEVNSPVQVNAFAEELGRMMSTHLSKNADYSPANVLGPGEPGLYTRIWDKCTRLMNLGGFKLYMRTNDHPATLLGKVWAWITGRVVIIDKIVYVAVREPAHESIDDTLLDLAVYGIIARLFRRNEWGK